MSYSTHQCILDVAKRLLDLRGEKGPEVIAEVHEIILRGFSQIPPSSLGAYSDYSGSSAGQSPWSLVQKLTQNFITVGWIDSWGRVLITDDIANYDYYEFAQAVRLWNCDFKTGSRTVNGELEFFIYWQHTSYDAPIHTYWEGSPKEARDLCHAIGYHWTISDDPNAKQKLKILLKALNGEGMQAFK